MESLPLADNFLVLIILAANSNPVDFCTHLRTIENAPLKGKRKRKEVTRVPSELLDFRQNVDHQGHQTQKLTGIMFVQFAKRIKKLSSTSVP